MRRLERFKFLQLFGDGKPHNYFEIIFLGVQYLKVKQSYFEEKVFKRALESGLVKREGKRPNAKDDNYIITPRGDECLREEQIARDGDVSYYKYYDRSVHGKWGVDHFAPLPKFMKNAKPIDTEKEHKELDEHHVDKLGKDETSSVIDLGNLGDKK